MSQQLAYKTPWAFLSVVAGNVQKKIMEESTFISATPEAIWRLLTHPDCIPLWERSLQEVNLSYWSYMGESDVSSVCRTLYKTDDSVQKQIVTDWQPNKTLGYTTIEGLRFHRLNIHLHIGLFRLFPCIDGTEVQWTNYIEFYETSKSKIWLSRLMRKYHRSLACLKWYAENLALEPRFSAL